MASEWGSVEWGAAEWGGLDVAATPEATGSLELTGSGDGTVSIAAVATGLLELNGTGTGSAPVSGEAAGTLTLNGSATGTTPLTVVADLPVEWDGSFDLVLTWETIQRLIDELAFSWLEIAKEPILNAALPFTWNEQNPTIPLTFSWVELPAGLLDAYELDPQRPYGRVTKP